LSGSSGDATQATRERFVRMAKRRLGFFFALARHLLKHRDALGLAVGRLGLQALKQGRDLALPLRQRLDLVGSSTASLHAKTFVMDRNRLFVGSYNFDPRSTNLNTEMGFLIHSPKMAQQLASEFDRMTKEIAYCVTRTQKGGNLWTEYTEDGTKRLYYTEPKTTWTTRTAVRVISWLPVMWML